MTRKSVIAVSSAAVCIVVFSAVSAISLRGGKEPDFTDKKPEEIEAYFESDAFRSMNRKDQIAIKRKAYAPIIRQKEQAFIEQAQTYSQLPPQQKVVYLDRMIDKMVRNAEQKRANAPKRMQGTQIKGDSIKTNQPSSANKTFAPENYRAATEKMTPEIRAYILGLKEALRDRMEQRGIEIPGQGFG